MNEDILNCDWENIIDNANDANQACSNFTNTFITMLCISCFSVQTIKDRGLFYGKNWIIYNLLIFQNSSLEMNFYLKQQINWSWFLYKNIYMHLEDFYKCYVRTLLLHLGLLSMHCFQFFSCFLFFCQDITQVIFFGGGVLFNKYVFIYFIFLFISFPRTNANSYTFMTNIILHSCSYISLYFSLLYFPNLHVQHSKLNCIVTSPLVIKCVYKC